MLLGDWAMSVFHSKVFGVIVVQEVTLGVCPVIGEFFFFISVAVCLDTSPPFFGTSSTVCMAAVATM